MFKSALMLTPVFLIIALAFWFILPSKSQPVIINDQKQTQTETAELTGLTDKLNSLEDKVTQLEGSNSALITKINSLQTGTKTNNSELSGKKSPVLIPINPGGNIDSNTWTNLTSGSIAINPADYPGYKNAYLIINLSVYVGQGTAYARLVNSQNGLAIIPSTVSTGSYLPVSLTSSAFQLPPGQNSYTVQLYTQVPGYPAQAGNSFLQITY
jgi:cell division protein FtsB